MKNGLSKKRAPHFMS